MALEIDIQKLDKPKEDIKVTDVKGEELNVSREEEFVTDYSNNNFNSSLEKGSSPLRENEKNTSDRIFNLEKQIRAISSAFVSEGGKFILGGEGTLMTKRGGARVVLTNGNDIELYDDSTGGTNPTTGNSADLKFIRTDDSSDIFTIRKRSGINNDAENVVDMYFEQANPSNVFNSIFIGRSGNASNYNTGTVGLSANIDTSSNYNNLNGNFEVDITTNGSSAKATILSRDARAIFSNNSYSGIVSYLQGFGTNGQSALIYNSSSSPTYYIVADTDQLQFVGNFYPLVNNTYSVGTATYKLSNLYTTKINNVTPISGSGSFYVAATSGASPTTKVDYSNGIITAIT